MKITTLARWAQAPEWLSLSQAAALLMPVATRDGIEALIENGAVVARRDHDGEWQVGKLSLATYQEDVWSQRVEARKRVLSRM